MSKDRVIINYLRSVLNTLVHETSINYNNNEDIKFMHGFIKKAINFIDKFDKKAS
jgi:hypothetical protein